MFGKKLSKGFLVDSSGGLVKEFVFSQKADVDFAEIQSALQGKSDLGSLSPFQVGKSTATVIKGDKLHFIAVGKGFANEEDIGFFRAILNSVERSFDSDLQERAKKTIELEELARLGLENSKQSSLALESHRKDLAQESEEIETLRKELEHLRIETEGWQKELEEFEGQVDDRHAQINDRVTILLEREQGLVKSKQAFEVASDAKRTLGRRLQISAAELMAQAEAGFLKLRTEESELASKQGALNAALKKFEEDKTLWIKEIEQSRESIQGMEAQREGLSNLSNELDARQRSLTELTSSTEADGANIRSAIEQFEEEKKDFAVERDKANQSFAQMQAANDGREQNLKVIEEDLNNKRQQYELALAGLKPKQDLMDAKAEELHSRIKELEERERALAQENAGLEKRRADVDRNAEVQQKEMSSILGKIGMDSEDLRNRTTALDSRELTIREMESKTKDSETRLEVMLRDLDKSQKDLERRETAIRDSIATQEATLQIISEKEAVQGERERAILAKEGALAEARAKVEAQRDETVTAKQDLERIKSDIIRKETVLADETRSLNEREERLREETENLRRRQEGLKSGEENLDSRVKALADKDMGIQEEFAKSRGTIGEEMARLEAERNNVAGRFAELEMKEKGLSVKEEALSKAQDDMSARELGFKEKIEEMNRHRQSLESDMDKLAQEKQQVEQMHSHLDKRKKVIVEQVDSIAEITKKLEELRAKSRKRAEEAAAQASTSNAGENPPR
jgi:chromosome segregation ATPase